MWAGGCHVLTPTLHFFAWFIMGITRAEDAKRGLYLLDQVYELMYQIAKK